MKTIQAPSTTYVYCNHCGTARHNRLSECPTLQAILMDLPASREEAPQEQQVAGMDWNQWACLLTIIAIGVAVALFNNWMAK